MQFQNDEITQRKQVNSKQMLGFSDLFSALIGLTKIPSSNTLRLNRICLLISQNQASIEKDLNQEDAGSDRRFSFLAANPNEQQRFTTNEQIHHWKQCLTNSKQGSSITSPDLAHIPFHSGWIGYFSYPSNKQVNNSTRNKTALAEFNYYPWAICLDHQAQVFHLLGRPDSAAKEAFNWLLQAQADLSSVNLKHRPIGNLTTEFKADPFAAKWAKADYQQAFDQIQDYLLAGDCYQVNLTQPFVSPKYSGSAIDALLPLFNALEPSFGCYFQGHDCELVSVSPERFISIDSHGKLEAKPIKGTIKRSNDVDLDKELVLELVNSDKNRAENLMIVDLLRNDLSMSAMPGSVQVDKLLELESHPNVHHLVSTISAQLRPDTHQIEAICSAFPGGSITGAPKKRAMEIIEELEIQPRSLYCGSFGYFSDTGNTDFNILIRSLEFRDGTITCWGGGGITVDSEMNDEYEESITKIRRIMDVVENIGKP
jgi:para-aminobenzoate synthetase component 1